ncbi:hypothetical protein ACFX19_041835 [Malus domestica]
MQGFQSISRSLLTQLSSAFLTLQCSSTPSVNCNGLSTVCLVKPDFACGFIRRRVYDFSGVGALLITKPARCNGDNGIFDLLLSAPPPKPLLRKENLTRLAPSLQ